MSINILDYSTQDDIVIFEINDGENLIRGLEGYDTCLEVIRDFIKKSKHKENIEADVHWAGVNWGKTPQDGYELYPDDLVGYIITEEEYSHGGYSGRVSFDNSLYEWQILNDLHASNTDDEEEKADIDRAYLNQDFPDADEEVDI